MHHCPYKVMAAHTPWPCSRARQRVRRTAGGFAPGVQQVHAEHDEATLVLRHALTPRAHGWDTARFDAAVFCVQIGPGGDVIAAGDVNGRIHLVCAHTGEKGVFP